MIFSASLRIYHPSWSLAKVRKHVGLVPKFKHDLGRPRETPDGQPLPGIYERTFASFPLYSGAEISFEDFFHDTLNEKPFKDLSFDALIASGGSVEILLGMSITDNEWFSLDLHHINFLNMAQIRLTCDIYGAPSSRARS